MTDGGILGRDSVARRLNRETFLLLGGAAALLMQVAHPLVAAGVDRHSDFRRDPFGRLVRTLNTTLAIVFGTTTQARAALGRIDRRHAGVHGTSASGERYDARDPRLLVWVETTLVLTSLRLYELVLGPLSDADREAYWSEGRYFATELGAPSAVLPPTYAALLAYEREMLASEVRPDATAVTVGRDVLRPLAWLPGIAYWPVDVVTAGLLPPPLRQRFGLRFAAPERIAFRSVIAALRLAVPLLPRRLRVVPQARRYEERMRQGSPLLGHARVHPTP